MKAQAFDWSKDIIDILDESIQESLLHVQLKDVEAERDSVLTQLVKLKGENANLI